MNTLRTTALATVLSLALPLVHPPKLSPDPLRKSAGDDSTLHEAQGHIETLHTLTLEGARLVVHAVVSEAQRLHVGGAVAVVDAGGELLCLERIDGTFPAASGVSTGKARTSARFRKPTRDFEKTVNDGRTTMVALPDFTPLQGGVPLVVDGHVVGAVGVSGASSAQQDDELAMHGAAALLQAP